MFPDLSTNDTEYVLLNPIFRFAFPDIFANIDCVLSGFSGCTGISVGECLSIEISIVQEKFLKLQEVMMFFIYTEKITVVF